MARAGRGLGRALPRPRSRRPSRHTGCLLHSQQRGKRCRQVTTSSTHSGSGCTWHRNSLTPGTCEGGALTGSEQGSKAGACGSTVGISRCPQARVPRALQHHGHAPHRQKQ